MKKTRFLWFDRCSEAHSGLRARARAEVRRVRRFCTQPRPTRAGAGRGVDGFEITVCDLKHPKPRRPAHRALCLHRAGRGDAVHRAGQHARHRGGHRDHAYLRARAGVGGTHGDLAKRLAELEEKTEGLAMSHDTFSRNTRNHLKQVFDALRELMTPPDPPKRPIGFVTPEDKDKKASGARLKS